MIIRRWNKKLQLIQEIFQNKFNRKFDTFKRIEFQYLIEMLQKQIVSADISI